MFKPLHPGHAIHSVIFRLTGDGAIGQHEQATLDDGYQKYLKAALPSERSAQQMVVAAVGPTPPEGTVPLEPKLYADFARTGEAAWWMEVVGPVITVGCSQYGGWSSTRAKACKLLRGLGKTLGAGHPLAQIRSVELTYQNLFTWDGPGRDSDPKLVIHGDQIPKKAERSKEWNRSEGWVNDIQECRVLERFQIAAELYRHGNRINPVIQIVTSAMWGYGENPKRLDLETAFGTLDSNFQSTCDGRAIFEDLHERSHGIIRPLVTNEIADLIGLPQPRAPK